MATDPVQPFLIPGFYRCDDCGALVERLRKNRRFRLCDACYERVVPEMPEDGRIEPGSPLHEALTRYWEWYGEMEKRVPPRRPAGPRPQKPLLGPVVTADAYYPYCACGERRKEVTFRSSGLFGGPFLPNCLRCDLKRSVESAFRSTAAIHPEWDDETWLDFLMRVYPEAFEMGVLPGYWYELRYPGITRPTAAATEPVDPLARRPRQGVRR